MAKGEHVSWTLEGYVPGVENHENFLGVCFRKNVTHLETTKEKDAERGTGIKITSKLFGLKPLGAVAPVGKTLDKALIQTLFKLAKGDAERVVKAYLVKNPTHEVNVEKVQAMCASTEQTAKDLLAQV